MSHLDDQRDPAAALPDPAAAKEPSWRFWAALVPDHPVWSGRFSALRFAPELELSSADALPGDPALFHNTTH